MKRLFTFAIVALIAAMAFAQSQQAQRRVAYTSVERAMQTGLLGPQAQADALAKAQAATEVGETRLVRAGNHAAAFKQLTKNDGIVLKDKVGSRATTVDYKAPAKVTETDGNLTVTKDENGIITDVQGGTTKYYERTAGYAYATSNYQLARFYQSGIVTTVEDGNNVYILNPMSLLTTDSWIKGVKDGDKLKVNTHQPILYDEDWGTLSVRWGVMANGNGTVADDHATEFTFAIDGDKLTLEGTVIDIYAEEGETAYFMGLFYDDDDYWTRVGDCQTELTHDPTYTPPTLVELPEDATVEAWFLNGSNAYYKLVKNRPVNVSFNGDDVYVQGIFEDFPESWVKGTKNGDNYEFENLQFLGNYSKYDIWFMGIVVTEAETEEDTDSETIVAPKAAFDAEAKTLTFDCTVLANAFKEEIYALEWLDDVVLSAEEKEYPEPVLNELTTTLPYLNTFETEAEQDEVAIYDRNEDGHTFKFYQENGGNTAARYNYSDYDDADDYLAFPAVELKAGTIYMVSLDVRAERSSYPEKVAVVCGLASKASEMTDSVIPSTEVANTAYSTLANRNFTVEKDTVYSFAVKACSDAGMWNLFVDNFMIREADLEAPAALTGFTVTPNPTGACNATVSVTLPTKNLKEETLDGFLLLDLYVDGELVKSYPVTPGDTFSKEITVPTPSTYNVKVVAKYLDSDGVYHESVPAEVDVWIGVDLPTNVADLEVTDKNDTVAMSWTAPEYGKLGEDGIFFPDSLKYNVYPVELIDFGFFVYPYVDYENPYVLGIDSTNYNVEFNTNEGAMQFTYFAVAAENEAGVGAPAYNAILTGAPYTLPVKESAAGGTLNYWWGSNSDEDNYELEGGLYLGKNPSDGDEYNFSFVAETAGWLTLESGKLNLKGCANPVVMFDACGDGKLEVSVVTLTGEKTLFSTGLSGIYNTITVPLGANYDDEEWVRVVIKGEFEEAGVMDVDNIKIVNLLDNNLVVTALAAPAKVNVGADIVATLTVENQGRKTATAADYKVKFTVNGEDVEVEGKTIATDEKADFTYTIPTSAVSEESYTLKAELVFAADQAPENNVSSEVTTRVAFPNYPTVDNLTAEAKGTAVTLKWTEPSLATLTPEAVTEDFESYEPFQFGNAIGGWTLVDGDGTPMGGIDALDIPNLIPGTTKGSYFLINNESEDFNQSFEANSGAQYLSTMFSVDQTNTKLNDWLISPVLPGSAQTISFYAKSYTESYGLETFQVLYSTTDMATESFVAVSGETDVKAPAEWTEYTYDLPEGAKYFAIRCTSNDAFMFFVDDITYLPANASAANIEIVGYNVYRNGEKVNAEPVAETEYTDADLAETTDYDYAVTTVYTKGESKAVHASATTTGIEGIGVDAADATYYNLQGVQVAKPAAGTTCIRVINGKAVKVIIR